MQKEVAVFIELVNTLLKDEKENPVAEFISAEEVFDRLDLSLSDYPINEVEFKLALEKLVLSTPRTATNAFFNQLFGGRNPKAVLGDLLAVILNNSMYTYKAAGPQVGVEKAVINKVCELIGWDKNAGGTFASGGSLTNFMAMLMARDFADNRFKYSGASTQLIVYTSKDSHYSIPKNAAFSGIGRDNVRYISTDEYGRMDAAELNLTITKDIALGYKPIMVNVTAGTTVLGAFDPIADLSSVCKKHNVWLHVDGAYCGSVLFSSKYKHLIKGIEQVDSFSFNAHKMIGTPLTCSLILVKDKMNLFNSFSNEASYLYQTDHDDFNLGKTSLQCGRRNDALKFWTLWKSVGTKGLEQIVDHQFDLADVARDYVKNNPDYTLYSFEESISICFNYKGISARKLCTMLYEESELMVGYGSFNGIEFIRLVTINAQNKEEDILNFFTLLEQFVEENQEKLIENKIEI